MNLREELDVPVSTVVLAEGEFGEPNGKTANGVVMHSDLFDVRAVVDSTKARRMAADVLENPAVSDIPVVESVDAALAQDPDVKALVVGIAPPGGDLPDELAREIERAIEGGCDIVSGLHVFLTESAYWRELARDTDVELFDVRKPPDSAELSVGKGRAEDVETDIVLVAGTDCAIGKRTTCVELYRAALDRGLNAGWVATGQTGIMVGAHRGAVVDRIPADFVSGVVEHMIVDLSEDVDLIFVEGQAAITHRSYGGVALGILQGSWPDAVVIADDPDRTRRAIGRFPVPDIHEERDLVETLSEATVAAISTWGDGSEETDKNGLPAANVFRPNGGTELLNAVLTEL